MERLGLVGNVSGGIQIDVNVATERLSEREFLDASLCDHNCRIQTDGKKTGNYDCPAAITRHPGLSVKTLAPTELLIEAINRTAQGIRVFNQSFLREGLLDDYYQKFRIPRSVQPAIEEMIEDDSIEVNLFGGNPELHPGINEMIRVLKDSGFVVNLTTTGARFMRDSEFIQRILESPPNILALSADDFESVEHIGNLADLSMEEIRERWKRIPMVYGQKRKAHEAIFVSKLAEQYPQFPRILFNLVVHQGNLPFIEEIIGVLEENFSNAVANPYPGQSAFCQGESVWQHSHLESLEGFVNNRIAEHVKQKNRLVPRLHYWLMMKAVFVTHRNDPKEIVRNMSGYGVWKCYETPGAGRYVQIGASPEHHAGEKIAGGHLACFWNSETVTRRDRQSWEMEPGEIVVYMARGMRELAEQTDHPCPGCIMPRLNFDMVSLERGMNKELVPAYLELRKEYVGF